MSAGALTYYVRSFGCQMNEHDAERIRAVLDGLGLRERPGPADADVLVYNSCTVRRNADERLAGHLSQASRLKREDPRRLVVVTGCLPPARGRELFEDFPFVDLAVGPAALPCLGERLEALLADRRAAPCLCLDEHPLLSGDLPAARRRPCQAWVQIMTGCTNRCSYCIVPSARGPERSRDAESVVREVRGLVADGVVEVTLLGQNVNSYGLDLRPATRPGFPDLLRRLDEIDGLKRVRFMTSHPRDLSDDLIDAMASCATVCEHLHLPLQSGSDAVLHAMRRGYTVDWYLERVAAVRAAVPDLALTTDLIVGFPGETDGDAQATLDIVREAGFEAAFTFVYSQRPGTEACDLPDQIPDDVKRRRIRTLIDLVQEQARLLRSAAVGRRVEVLVEGHSRHGGQWRGRTRQNTTVNFVGDASPGALVDVRITGATSTTLNGCV